MIECPMSELQHCLCESLRLYRNTDSGDENRQRDALLSRANNPMQLRKILNHPFLELDSFRRIPDQLYANNLVQTSGKMKILDILIKKLVPENHKVLVDIPT